MLWKVICKKFDEFWQHFFDVLWSDTLSLDKLSLEK